VLNLQKLASVDGSCRCLLWRSAAYTLAIALVVLSLAGAIVYHRQNWYTNNTRVHLEQTVAQSPMTLSLTGVSEVIPLHQHAGSGFDKIAYDPAFAWLAGLTCRI
jgi:hypothetical protein